MKATITGELVPSRNLDSAGLRLQLEDGKTLNDTLKGEELRDGHIFASSESRRIFTRTPLATPRQSVGVARDDV